MKRLNALLRKRCQLSRSIEQELQRLFPVGADIAWTVGKFQQRGEVLWCGWERLKVMNYATRKELFINLHRVVGVR